jgi:ribose transport system substrate-binding protein
VTNTASVGGAGVKLAYELLSGQQVEQTAGAGRPNTILLDPQILDNTTPDGQAALKAWISVPGMDPLWPLSLSIPGWTDYDPNTVPSSCQGA